MNNLNTNIMKSKIIIILTLSSFLLMNFGCEKEEGGDPNTNTYPIDLSFTEIGKGEIFNGTYNPIQYGEIFINQNDWGYFKDSIWQIVPLPPEANVDFSQNIVIAVLDEPRTTGGHSIEINSIVENEQNIVVNFYKPNTGDATQVPSRPYHIVKIPKTTKPIEFKQR